jgi:DNA-binding MarR family transcriptional regulator
MDDYDRLLVALRRIVRMTDLNAKRLAKQTGLTPPQLLILQSIQQIEDATIGGVAKDVNLTQATITSIVDRLEHSNLVVRSKSAADRRKVHVSLTDTGRDLLQNAPLTLQHLLRNRFEKIEDWEKSFLVAALDRMAVLLEADQLDASPILYLGSVVNVEGDKNGQ